MDFFDEAYDDWKSDNQAFTESMCSRQQENARIEQEEREEREWFYPHDYSTAKPDVSQDRLFEVYRDLLQKLGHVFQKLGHRDVTQGLNVHDDHSIKTGQSTLHIPNAGYVSIHKGESKSKYRVDINLTSKRFGSLDDVLNFLMQRGAPRVKTELRNHVKGSHYRVNWVGLE